MLKESKKLLLYLITMDKILRVSAIVVVAVVAIFVAGTMNNQQGSERVGSVQGIEGDFQNKSYLEVVGRNGNVSRFETTTAQNTTVLDMMRKLDSENSEFRFDSEASEYGEYIVSINGHIPNVSKNEFWKLFVNGEESVTGVSMLTLRNNDVVRWEIDTF